MRRVFVVGLLFELSLVPLSLLLGRWWNEAPLEGLRFSGEALGIGTLAAVPLLVLFVAGRRWPIGPLRRIWRILERTLRPVFEGCSIVELALFSLAAGFGEEMLFRGVLQPVLGEVAGPPLGQGYEPLAGLVAASVLFGLAHCVTATYAVLASVIGFAMGGLFLATGNLLVPVTAHAVYDFVALVYFLQLAPRPARDDPTPFRREAAARAPSAHAIQSITTVNTNPMDHRQRLIELVKRHALEFGDFTLTSGKQATYYLDGKQVTLDAEGAQLIGGAILDAIADDRPDAVGGMTIGADPIVGAVLAEAGRRGTPLKGFLVRKEAKGHGKQRWVEGPLQRGSRVVIVEDVVTTGGSSLAAIGRVEELDCQVVCVVCLVDRLEGGREAFESRGYAFTPLLTITDLGLQAPKSP